jgi:hypothetical protein
MYPPIEDSKGILATLRKFGKFIKHLAGATPKEMRDEVKEATLAMLPRWHFLYCNSKANQELMGSTAEEVIQRIESVYRCMERSFKSESWKEVSM